MARGSGGDGPISKQIIINLSTAGSIDQAIDQLQRAKAAQEALAQSSAAAASAGDKLEAATYEVGNAYQVVESEIRRVTTALEKEVASAAWMARQADELSAALEGMAAHERTAATATDALAVSQTKAGAGAATAGSQGGLSAYKWLLLGNAIQDVQYGFAAIVNNIPGIVMSFGGSAGLAGGIGIAAVAAQQLLAHIGDIRKMLGEETPQRLIYDVKALGEELKALEAKEFKTKIDYSDIEIATRKIEQLTEAQQAFERLKSGKSKATQEAGKLATEAIIEYGGGDDFTSSAERVSRAAAAVTPVTESDQTRKLREQIAKEEAGLANLSPESQVARGRYIDQLKAKLAGSIGDDSKNHADVIAGQVGRAGEGYAGDIKWLRELIEANPAAFKSQGAQPGLLPGLRKAGRDQIEDRRATENLVKIQEDNRKQAEKLARDKEKLDDASSAFDAHADQAFGHAVNEGIGRVRGGFDDHLEKALFDALKGGATPEAAMAGQRGALVSGVGARLPGVNQGVVAGVVDALLRKAADAALNLIAEQKKPALDVKADATAKKAGHDAQVAGNKAQTERDKAVNKLDDGFKDQVEYAINQNRIAQVTHDPSAVHEKTLGQQIEAKVADVLRRSGQDPSLAGGIVNKLFEDANTKYTAAFAQTGNNLQALINLNRNIIGHMGQVLNHQQDQAMQIRGLFDAHARQRGRGRMANIPRAITVGAALAGLGVPEVQARAVEQVVARNLSETRNGIDGRQQSDALVRNMGRPRPPLGPYFFGGGM